MSGARYAEIANDLTEGIAAGRFPVGSLLPTEIELCARYGASRHTIRSALDELQDAGLVSRRKRVGTRVEAARPADEFRQSLASVEDLVHSGERRRREVREVERVSADERLAAELGFGAGAGLVRISSLRFGGEAGAAPLGWTDVYVDASYAEVAEMMRMAPETLVSDLIDQRFGRRVAEIVQDLEAALLPDREAAALGAPAQSPALRIVRRYADVDGDVFVASVTLHPAGRFTLSSTLRRT